MEKLVTISVDHTPLVGNLIVPPNAHSLVIFAHGSGSSRLSPRNRFVAETLQQERIATLLIDLLTEEEDENYETRFDIPLLTERLTKVTRWIEEHYSREKFRIGFFGASTGAGAALRAAADLGHIVSAIVSRGGRPDLATDALGHVTAPTLLIVGGDDTEVIKLNTYALGQLHCEKKLEIVPGATHLFEEEGTLEEVSRLATAWFKKHLA